jgi:hypothetical protein
MMRQVQDDRSEARIGLRGLSKGRREELLGLKRIPVY